VKIEVGDFTFAVQDKMVYPLTECCEASAKGSEGGIVCRRCYRAIDDLLGMGWTWDDPELVNGLKVWFDLLPEEIAEVMAAIEKERAAA